MCHIIFGRLRSKKRREGRRNQILGYQPVEERHHGDQRLRMSNPAIQHIELRSRERGYMQNIFVDEGKFVKQGQVMFQIMPLLLKAELQKAEAEAKFAEIEYLNTKQLADSNVVSVNELALRRPNWTKQKPKYHWLRFILDSQKSERRLMASWTAFRYDLGALSMKGPCSPPCRTTVRCGMYFNVPEAEYLNFRMNEKKTA